MRLGWRRRRTRAPEPEAKLEIRLEREWYAPGETIRGSVVPTERRASEEIEVWAGFHERGTEYQVVPVTIPGERIEDGGDAGVQRFVIALPRDALPSYTSRHGALWWEVAASVGDPAANDVATRRIHVRHPRPTAEGSAGAAGPAADRPLRG